MTVHDWHAAQERLGLLADASGPRAEAERARLVALCESQAGKIAEARWREQATRLMEEARCREYPQKATTRP